ncbi:MAG TPA: cytochrome P450 [Acidimicrobiales bacterium]|nr:cytochrome P450 [Acidimicrobiales bacterium]
MSDTLLDRARLRRLFDLRGEVFDTRGGSYPDDPNPTFNRLRSTGPVHPGTPHEALGVQGSFFFEGLPYPSREHFTAYDFKTCANVLRDESRFVTNQPPLAGERPLTNAGMLFMDGVEHRNHRALVQPSFVPARAVWWLENWIEATVHRLIDGLEAEGAADLNVEFCAPIPLLTITGSFGIGVDEALEVRAAVTSDGHDLSLLPRLVAPIVASRRSEPRDDLITVLAQAEITDEDGQQRRLSDEEIVGFSVLLLGAGSGTTWKQMGITLMALLQHPEALATARDDPEFVKAVAEESLRWAPTDPVFARFVAEDTELAGVELPGGSVIHVCLASANRDPVRWERPDEFDPFRPFKPHLGFGRGPHTCLGMHVARAEMISGVTTLLERLPNLRLDPDAPPPRIVGLYERGPTAVPVRFD